MSVTLFRDAALADGTGPDLRLGVSVLVDADRVAWIGPSGDEPDPGPDASAVDAAGCTIVPGMVDSHSHLTLPGGAHWIDRAFDPPAASTAEASGPGSGSSPLGPIQATRSAPTSTLTPSRRSGPVPSASAASRNNVTDMPPP